MFSSHKFSFAILFGLCACTNISSRDHRQGGSGGAEQGGEGGGEIVGAGGNTNTGGGGSNTNTGGGGGRTNTGGGGGTSTTGGAGGSQKTGGTGSGGVSTGGTGSGGVSTGGTIATGGSGGMKVGGSSGTFITYTGWPFDATEALRRQRETATALGLSPEVNVDLGGGVMMAMAVIPAGETTMGSPASTPGAEGDERLRAYTQKKPFLIAKTEFTRAQYNALIGSFPMQPADVHARALLMTNSTQEPALAVYTVMRDVVLAALKARAPNGWTFRIPSIDEWEHAARAGAGTIWYSGDDPASLGTIAWYNGNSGRTLHDVGLKLPNAWGLFDTIGNAWEYVFRAGPDYGDADPTYHFIRGCEAGTEPYGNGCRTSNLGITDTGVGYRFVADVP